MFSEPQGKRGPGIVDRGRFEQIYGGGKTVLGLVDGEGGKFPEWVEPWDVRVLPAAADFTPFAGMNMDDVGLPLLLL